MIKSLSNRKYEKEALATQRTNSVYIAFVKDLNFIFGFARAVQMVLPDDISARSIFKCLVL